ncbi:MAG TPA: hypothetical protein VHE83_16225, partial [Mycobacteriales bacterium]|nr:hypothetical protein [Mycobacteriales bacterium]
PGAGWPQAEAPAAPAPVPLAPEAALAEAPAAPKAAKSGNPRPRWVAPAAGVALVGSAAAAYFVWFGGGSTSDNNATLPQAPVHHAARLTPALLTSTLPAGFTAEGAPVDQKVTEILPGQVAGHAVTGATAAESLDAKNAKGSEISALALQFPTADAAKAFTTAKAPAPKGQVVAYSSRGVFAFAVETDSPKDAAASAAVAAWAKSLGG